MPLNEAEGFRLTNLTDRQQREAMQALYGLEKEPMSPETLTYEDRVKMRRHLDQLDAQESSKANRDFDLNKPPTAPYVYKEYPFLMYNHETNQSKAAPNHEVRQRMLAEGWSESPLPPEPPPEIPLTAAEHAEVASVDSKLEKRKK